jgi:multicomponent Na+:H+ antiporter subunit D
MAQAPSLPVSIESTSTESLLYGVSATFFAGALAFVGLYRRRLPRAPWLGPPVRVLHALHSGVVGDYVTWVAVGVAVTGGVWALLLHG